MRFSVFPPVSLLLGLGSGFLLFKGPAPRITTPVTAQKESVATAMLQPDLAAATDTRAQRLLAAALRKGNAFERNNELYLAIEALTAADFRRLIGDTGALRTMGEKLRTIDGETLQALTAALVARWLAVDPGTAMAWVPRGIDLISRESVRGIFLDAFSKSHPEETLGLAASRKDPGERKEIIALALRELAVSDLAKARAWLNGCTDPSERRVGEQAVREGIVRVDPLRVIELAGTTENRRNAYDLLYAATDRAAQMGPGVLRQLGTAPMAAWMFAAVSSRFAEEDPELAVELALKANVEESSRNWGVGNAFSALARRDLPQALAKVESLTGPQRAAAIPAIGREWAEQDPAGALAWLSTLPAGERIDSGQSFGTSDVFLITLTNWVENSPADARAWVDALPPGPTRDIAQGQVAQMLAYRGEPARAAQLLAGLGDAADSRIVKSVAQDWTRRDPRAAADWAVALPTGPMQSNALAGIVGSWSSESPEAVAAWLMQFPSGEARDRSITAFLRSSGVGEWSGAEQSAGFDKWLNLIDDPWRRAQAAVTRFRRGNRSDPAGARAWLSSLSNVDAEVIRMALRAQQN